MVNPPTDEDNAWMERVYASRRADCNNTLFDGLHNGAPHRLFKMLDASEAR